MSRYRGRYAPSPTGELHLGNLRTALVAWLCARSSDGEILLRIEDLDRDRCRPEHERSQLEDLDRLGLDWDGAILRQSERLGAYEAAFERLRADGLAYRCFCSRRDIREAASAEHGPGEEIPYPGTCAGLSDAQAGHRASAGEEHAWRIRAGGPEVTFEDLTHGSQAGLVDDFVLRRRDGAFSYNFAVVLDDLHQEVSEIVRGDDLLATTARHAFLHDLLGTPRPRWRHVGLVLDPDDGLRMAKRSGSRTLRGWLEAGQSVASLIAAFARSLGLEAENPGAAPDLLGGFSPDRVPAGPVRLP